MHFWMLIYKNLLRRPARSLLTIAGIAIGGGAVVALTSIAWGFQRTCEHTYESRGTDLIVISHSALPMPFTREATAGIASLPHIRLVAPVLTDVIRVDDTPWVIILGWEPGSYLWKHLDLVKGRWPANGEKAVVVGTFAAEMLGKTVGQKLQIEADEYTICGVFGSSAPLENGEVIMPLPEMQAATDHQGMINFLNIRLDPHATPAEVQRLRAEIKAKFPGLIAFSPAEIARNNGGVQLAEAMSLATSFIALIVGSVGIMNTVLMSVFERFQEFGLLLAIGWRRGRILGMILCESLLLSLGGGIAGILLGQITVSLIQFIPWFRGKLEGEISFTLMTTALLVALALGTLGGIYPAWIGARMSPSDALRHE